MWTKIISQRLVFLVGVLITAVVLAVLRQAHIRVVSVVCVALFGLLMLALPIAALLSLNARHPETFLVREGAFTTPPNANAVLTVAMSTAILVALVTETIDERHRSADFDRFEIAVVVLLLLVLPLQWYSVLGRFGLSLGPDGVLDRQPFGSMFVPWQAGPAAEPTSAGIKLRIRHPELVVRRGFKRGTTIRTGADRGFTAWAINLYVARLDYRRTIGTDDGLLLLKSH